MGPTTAFETAWLHRSASGVAGHWNFERQVCAEEQSMAIRLAPGRDRQDPTINGPRRAAASAQANAPFELVPKDVDELGTNAGKLRPDQRADAAAARRWKRLKVGGASIC